MVIAFGKSLVYARDIAPSKIERNTLIVIDGGHLHIVVDDECPEEEQQFALPRLGVSV